MDQEQKSRAVRHLARHLLVAGKVYVQRNRARKDIDDFLHRMRKSIIRMNLSYTDIDKLRMKIEKAVDMEREYAKLFKTEDKEKKELAQKISDLEDELKIEREEKMRIMSENSEKIDQLQNSLSNVKHRMNNILLERSHRLQRYKSIEKKINSQIDSRKYFK